MYYILVDKDTKRVEGFSSTKSEDSILLQIEIDENDEKYKDLLDRPFIYIYDNSEFILDSEYQKKLELERSNRIPYKQKLNNMVSSLAQSKIDLINEKNNSKNLTNELSSSKIEVMKLKSTNLSIVKELAEMKIKLAQQLNNMNKPQGGN